MTRLRGALLPALVLVVIFGAWELYVDASGVTGLLLPAPHQIARALFDDRSTLASNFFVTAKEIVAGIVLAGVAALVLSVAIHFFATLRRALLPLLIASQTIPIVIIAPLVILWLGFGFAPRLLVIALVCFFPLVITTLDALETVDPELIKLMRTFDAGRLETFRRVELPAVLPGLFTGAKLAAVFSVIGAVFAEQAGSSSGLGYLLLLDINQYLLPEAYAAVALLSGFAIALFVLLSAVERRALPWAFLPKGEPNR